MVKTTVIKSSLDHDLCNPFLSADSPLQTKFKFESRVLLLNVDETTNNAYLTSAIHVLSQHSVDGNRLLHRDGLVKDKIKAMTDTILVSQSVEVASGRHGPDHHRSPDRCRSHRPVTTGCQGSSKSIPSSDGTSRGSSTDLCTCRISIGLLVEGYRSDQAS